MSIKQKIINNKISCYDACINHYNEITQEDIDYIVENEPWEAAQFLNQHPLFTQNHVDCIVEKNHWAAAEYLNQHSFLTKKHVDIIVKIEPWVAAYYLSHRLSEENIAWIAHNHPEHLKEVFK